MIRKSLRSFLRTLLDLILPPLCFSCKKRVNDAGTLCSDCWSSLSFLGEPYCHHCGWPFPYEVPDQTDCQACATKLPVYHRGRSALIYEGVTRALILQLKHGDGTHVSNLLAGWLYQAGEPLLKDADVLIPVPLHWRRLLKRGYNQSTLLAQGLQKRVNLPIQSNWLKRLRPTPSQGGLTRHQRRKNVQAAFQVPATARAHLKGRIVVLIDDVYTTGSTLEACAKALLKAGSKEVRVLTVARVLKPEDISFRV